MSGLRILIVDSEGASSSLAKSLKDRLSEPVIDIVLSIKGLKTEIDVLVLRRIRDSELDSVTDSVSYCLARGVGILCLHDSCRPGGVPANLLDIIGIRHSANSFTVQNGKRVLKIARADPLNPLMKFPLELNPNQVNHPVLDGVTGFEIADEVWPLNVARDVLVLLTASVEDRVHASDAFPAEVPVLACRSIAAGRSCFFVPGHFDSTLLLPEVLRILEKTISWLASSPMEDDVDCGESNEVLIAPEGPDANQDRELREKRKFEYDVVLSFAGNAREYVNAVADYLHSKGIHVFFDSNEQVNLWGKDLFQHLTDVYSNKGQYFVPFISSEYAVRAWPRLEFRAALARSLREAEEYILPARFDNTELPGLLDTVGHVNISEMPPEELAKLIMAKIRGTPSSVYDHRDGDFFERVELELSPALEEEEALCEQLFGILLARADNVSRRANGYLGDLAKEMFVSEPLIRGIIHKLENKGLLSGLYLEGDGMFSVVVH